MRILLISFLQISFIFLTLGQDRTLGLQLITDQSQEAYILFTPFNSSETYLIDKCGHNINTWTLDDTKLSSASAYLKPDGTLVRPYKVNSLSFAQGGLGGGIDFVDKEGVHSSLEFVGNDFHPHHDIAVLENGNIMMIVWEKYDQAAQIEAGREESLAQGNVLSEAIYELEINEDSFEIVWEWHLWDHLVQEVDPLKNNYGIVKENIRKVDINYLADVNGVDWVHLNSIDYNEDLDQLIVSSRNFSEVWIIDHQYSTELTKGELGDLKYRTGYDASYQMDTDQNLFAQHDARWINNKQVSIFNNGIGRPGGNKTGVVILELPSLENNDYPINMDGAFEAPLAFYETLNFGGLDFFDSKFGGAQLLNDELLVYSGSSGNLLSVDSNNDISWSYILPANKNGPLTQGDQPSGNSYFKALSYDIDYPALQFFDVNASLPIELNPLPDLCSTNTHEALSKNDIQVNRVGYQQFEIISNSKIESIMVYDVRGIRVYDQHINKDNSIIYLSNLPTRTYIFIFNTLNGVKTLKHFVH